MTRIILLLVILIFGQCGLLPVSEVIDHTEVKINLAEAEQLQPEQPKPDPLYFEKVIEIDEEGYEAIVNTFKNIVLLITFDNDEQKRQIFQEVLQQINPKVNEIDVIFLTATQGTFKDRFNNPCIYIKHFEEIHQLYSKQFIKDEIYVTIKEIISPSMQNIEAQHVESYMTGDEVRALLVMEESHQFYGLVKENFEKMLKEDQLKEAGIKGLRVFKNASFLNYGSPSLLLYKPNEAIEKYEYNITFADQIADFFYLESLPIVVPLRSEYYARVFGGPIPMQMHLLIQPNDDNTQLLMEYQKAAENNKNNDLKYERIIFCYSSYEDNVDLWQQFDYTNETKTPKLVITKTNFRKFQLEKFIYDQEEINTDKIGEFIDKLRSREIDQFFRSEENPGVQNEIQSVVKVVGSTFSDEVLKGRKNVLVLFYDSKVPLASVQHEALIQSLAITTTADKFEILKIVKIDVGINEHPKIAISTAPLIYLYLAGDKRKPKEYKQELTLEQLRAWLTYWVVDLELVSFPEEGFQFMTTPKFEQAQVDSKENEKEKVDDL